MEISTRRSTITSVDEVLLPNSEIVANGIICNGMSSTVSVTSPSLTSSQFDLCEKALKSGFEQFDTLPDQAVVLESLFRIREYKQQVLNSVDKLKNNDDKADREILAKLIKAYDSFKEQEEQYFAILQKLLTLKQQYVRSLAESDNSDDSERTPLPSFSANLAVRLKGENSLNDQIGAKKRENASVLSKSLFIAKPPPFDDNKRRNSHLGVAEENRRLKQLHSNKASELDELKEKLNFLKALFISTDSEIVEAGDADGQKALENKLRILKSSKKRVDDLLKSVENASEEIQNSNDDDFVEPLSSAVQDSELNNQTGFQLFVADLVGRNAESALSNFDEMPTISQRNQFASSPGNEIKSEISETKNRIAKLQQNMRQHQNSSESNHPALKTSVRGGERVAAAVQQNERPENSSITVDDSDGDIASMAAVSFRMRSAYESKLNEQQQAVEHLQAEHERLMSIKSQLMSLSSPQIRQIANEVGEVCSETANNVIDARANEDSFESAYHQLQSENMRSSRLKTQNRSMHQNSIKEYNQSNIGRIKGRINENLPTDFGSFDHDEQDENFENALHQNDPSRITSNFRRNNQVNEKRGKLDDVPLPSTPLRRSVDIDSCAGGQQECRRSSSRERCGSISLDQQYIQLQQHIDSIRSIFQQLMRDHAVVLGAQHHQQQNVHAPFVAAQQTQQPFLLDAAAKLLAQQQQQHNNPWDQLYSSLNPASFAVQQQQLMVSLFSCQQQLQLQQMEMRYLQQLCQDLINSKRMSTTADGVHQQQQQQTPFQQQSRSRSDSLVQTNIQPPVQSVPLDGRPLSSASLYNLLAPNPYLTFPYYVAPQQPIYVGSDTEGANGLGDLYGRQRPRTFGATRLASNGGRYNKHGSGQHTGQMSQSLIERGSESVIDDGVDDEGKIMSVSDTAARSWEYGNNKSNLSKSPRKSNISEYTPSQFQQSDKNFENLRETIYCEVATLISQNEQRPYFLLELFRELQLLSSDNLRARALDAVKNVLSRYFTSNGIEKAEYSQQINKFDIQSQSVVEETQTESAWTTDDEALKQTSVFLPDLNNANKFLIDAKNEHEYLLKDSNEEESSKINTQHLAHERVHVAKNVEGNNEEDGRDAKDTTANKDFSKVSVEDGGLERHIQSVVDELIPFLKDNVDSVCNPQLLQYLRKLVISLSIDKCLPTASASTFFQQQLSSILDDTLAKFQGQELHDCGEELLGDVSEVVFNELSFFRLMQKIDTVAQPRRSEESDLGHDTTEVEDDTDGCVDESDVSSVKSSSPEPVEMTIHNDVSEISEDVDLSAITAVSVSREAVHIVKDEMDAKINLGTEIAATENIKSRRHSGDSVKSVEIVLTTPLTVQVTSPTDDDENSTSSCSSSCSASMHTAGNQVFDPTHSTAVDRSNDQASSSRETTPPDELLMDAEEIPETLDSVENTVNTQEREVTTFDLDYEPHPEDKLQLTIDSVEFRNMQNRTNVPYELEEEEDEVIPVVNEKNETIENVGSADLKKSIVE